MGAAAPDEFTLLGVLADIRQKTGVGDKPMLAELADILAELIKRESITPKALYKNIFDFVRRWKDLPLRESPEALDVISDFYLCMGAELR